MAESTLATWLAEHVCSDDYARRVEALKTEALKTSTALMTQADEVVVICDLIERLKPKLSIEIGSFFGRTSRQMAEAVSKHGGKLITVDPVGSHRMPGIIEQWPEHCRKVTEFRAVNSMELFSWVETETVRGRPTQIGVAFVDGNHRFEYALFDLLECGINLTPGGAIVIDNMELEGPRLAALQFLRLNPAWWLFFGGKLHDASATIRDLAPPLGVRGLWGVLIAPDALQIASTGRVFVRRPRGYAPVQGIKLNVVGCPAPTDMAVVFNYVGRPPDFHISGSGVTNALRQVVARIANVGPVDLTFEQHVTLALDRPDTIITLLCEMTVMDEGHYILLDPTRPFETM